MLPEGYKIEYVGGGWNKLFGPSGTMLLKAFGTAAAEAAEAYAQSHVKRKEASSSDRRASDERIEQARLALSITDQLDMHTLCALRDIADGDDDIAISSRTHRLLKCGLVDFSSCDPVVTPLGIQVLNPGLKLRRIREIALELELVRINRKLEKAYGGSGVHPSASDT